MSKQPNSDKSGRAARRREEKQVQQAQRTVARAQPAVSQGIDITALLAKNRQTMGSLTMERDMLSVQLEQRDELIVVLQKALEKVPSENETGEEQEEEENAEANE